MINAPQHRKSAVPRACLLCAAIAVVPLGACATAAPTNDQPDAKLLASAESLEHEGQWKSASDALSKAAYGACLRTYPGRFISPELKSRCLGIVVQSAEDGLRAGRPLLAADRFKWALDFTPDAAATARIRAQLNDAQQAWRAQQATAATEPPCSVTMRVIQEPSAVFARVEVDVSLDGLVVVQRGATLFGPAPTAARSVPAGEHELGFTGRYRYTQAADSYLMLSTSYYFECTTGSRDTIDINVNLPSELRGHDDGSVKFSYTETPKAP